MGFLNWFSKKFYPAARPQAQSVSTSQISISEKPIVSPTIQSKTQPAPASPISILEKQITGLGHPEYPFLSQRYSPSSRVPCTDFTGFIVDRLKKGDKASIKELMRKIIEGGPGLGCNPEWIDGIVDEMINAPIKNYILFQDEKTFLELKALWIIAGKSGGNKQFWIADKDRFAALFSRALCAYHFEPKSDIDRLISEANKFIRKFAEDLSFWKDYPQFNKNSMNAADPGESECRQKIRSLSVGARLHLFQSVGYGSGSIGLLDCSDYATRSMGLYIPQTAREITESRLLLPVDNPIGLSTVFMKNDLVSLCQEKGVEFRKSWNKDKLAAALAQKDPEFVKTTLKDRCVVQVNPAYAEDIKALSARAEQLKNLFKVLCFA